jgi:uncharacterized protein (TIGR02145 family)
MFKGNIMFRSLLFIFISIFILSGCGGGTSSSSTVKGVAQLGYISGGTVNLYEKKDLTKIVASTTTSKSTNINEAGSFTFENIEYDENEYYILEVIGGYDIDSNDDGIIDTSTQVELKGKFYAIVGGNDLINNSIRITALSDMAYLKIKDNLQNLSNNDIQQKLNEFSNEYLYDINEDNIVNHKDLNHFNPTSHRSKTKKSYSSILNIYVPKLHNGDVDSSKLASLLYLDEPVIKIENGNIQEIPFNLNTSVENLPEGLDVKWFLDNIEKDISSLEIIEDKVYNITAKIYSDNQLLKSISSTLVATKKEELVSKEAIVSEDTKIEVVQSDLNTDFVGATVLIPANSLSENRTISVKKSSINYIPTNNQTASVGDVLILEPSGLTFKKPVQVRIPYDETIDLSNETVKVARYSNGIVDFITPLYIDYENHEVVFETEHFTEFQLQTSWGRTKNKVEQTEINAIETELGLTYTVNEWDEILNSKIAGETTIYDLYLKYKLNDEIVTLYDSGKYYDAYKKFYENKDSINSYNNVWNDISKNYDMILNTKDTIEKVNANLETLLVTKKYISQIASNIGIVTDMNPMSFVTDYTTYVFRKAIDILKLLSESAQKEQVELFLKARVSDYGKLTFDSIKDKLFESTNNNGAEIVIVDGYIYAKNGRLFNKLGYDDALIPEYDDLINLLYSANMIYDLVKNYKDINTSKYPKEIFLEENTANYAHKYDLKQIIEETKKNIDFFNKLEKYENNPESNFDLSSETEFRTEANTQITIPFRIEAKGYDESTFTPKFEIKDVNNNIIYEFESVELTYTKIDEINSIFEGNIKLDVPKEDGEYKYQLYYEVEDIFRWNDNSSKDINVIVKTKKDIEITGLSFEQKGFTTSGAFVGVLNPTINSSDLIRIKLKFNFNEKDYYNFFSINEEDFNAETLSNLTITLLPSKEIEESYNLTTPSNLTFNLKAKIDRALEELNKDITAPNISTNSILSFDENSKIFFEPKATDDSRVTFKIEGEDKDFFVLNETTNIILSKESTDYETKKEYKITLIATDEYNNSSSKDIVININDINENVVLTPKITSLSPTSANLNEVVTFTVLGENIPSTVAMSLSDAECESVNYISSSKATISCTPKASGVKAFIVATKSGGEAINSDIALEVDVSNIEVINSCNLIKNNHTLASMLFNLDIGIESYDNPGYVTAPYLMENYEKYIPGMEVHAGVDFRSKNSNGGIARDEVYSLTDGKVVRADNQTSFGAVSIRRTNSSGQTVLISYGHLDEPNVEVGDIIKAGTLLGYTGDTGAPDAPHLHLEYRVNYANTSMVYNTSCGDNDCSKEEIKALTDNPIEILDLYCDSEKLPNLSLETNTPKTVNEEVIFTVNLSESLDTKYTVKISLGDGGGGYLSPVIMDTNSDSTSFTYKTSISKAGERKYRVAIFETDVQISSWVNDTYIINENSTDTITHNGLSYGTVISPTTGRVWLDRNIGASRVCTSATDELCFGDYFQWGRNADGHEKLNSNISTVQVTNISNVGHGDFIQLSYYDNVEYDWAYSLDSTGELRETQWNKIDGTSICPVGFRVPNKDELNDEIYTTIIQSKTNLELFSGFLKLPSAGQRFHSNSEYLNKNDAVYLWTSSTNTNGQSYYKSYDKNGSMSTYSNSYRTSGYSVRCIEDDSNKIVSENISNTVHSNSLRTPNGGEEWNNGEIQTIQWSRVYISSAFVDLYVLNDSSDGLLDKSSETLGNVVNTKKWYKFASKIENNSSYELDPALLNGSGNDYMILIVASDDKTKWDISDGTFSLNNSADSSNDNSIGHNGFVYNAITSSKTGRVWLDRNIGATKVCNSDISDFESYEMYMIDQIDCFGDYYQAKENNGNLNITNWEKSDGTSICPVGFKVPNAQEFFEEITTSSNTVYAGDMSGSHSSFDTNSSFLNLPFSGYKNKDGNIVRSEESLDLFNSNQVSIGSFWTSGQSSNSLYSDKYYSIHFFSDLKVQPRLLMNLENSFNIRCIKNEENGFIIK